MMMMIAVLWRRKAASRSTPAAGGAVGKPLWTKEVKPSSGTLCAASSFGGAETLGVVMMPMMHSNTVPLAPC